MAHPADESSVVSRVAGRVRQSASVLRRPLRLWSRSATKDGDPEVALQDEAVDDTTRLNYDVLYAVMRFLKFEELLLVMHTCRTLYQFGVPLLLRATHYTHIQQRHVLYRHLLLSDPSRFFHIVSLQCTYMDHPLASPSTPSLFVDFLRYATQLRALDILFNPGVEVEDSVLAPIAALPHLRRLHLRGCEWYAFAQLLAIITAPLVALGVHLHGPLFDFGYPRPTLLDIFTPVAAFRESLVLLELEISTNVDVSEVPQTAFPRVQSLVWRSGSAVDAATLAALFPAVHELDVTFNVLPQAAAAQQRQRGLDGTQWAAAHRLRRVRGTCLSVWLLGLRCRAHELVLEVRTAPGIVTDVVHDVRPTRLVATIDVPAPVLESATLETFMHSGLEELELVVALLNPFLLDAVSKLYALLKRSALEQATAGERTLRQLRVGFETTGRICAVDVWQQYYARVNWEFLAKTIFVSIPSMLNIYFDISGCTSFVWHRNQCEGALLHDTLFRESLANPPPTTPKLLEKIMRRQ